MSFILALRNLLRHGRRSRVTILAIALGAMSLVIFGEYVAYVRAGLETSAVRRGGHLTVFRRGYVDLGAGNPARYSIEDYRRVLGVVAGDPEIASRVNVATPVVTVTGIAGNYEVDASKTFLGTGSVPRDRARMDSWDEHQIRRRRPDTTPGLADDDDTRGVIGEGLARLLGLCDRLDVTPCPSPAARSAASAERIAPELADLASREGAANTQKASTPRIDLLAATAGGAPNVVNLSVGRAEGQGVRELDDSYVGMHFALAQRLLFGKDAGRATAVQIQLHHTADTARVRKMLAARFAAAGLDLELRDYTELSPFYRQAMGMFGAIFAFIAVILGVIVVFTVANTMGMTVVERTNEIGTARAMGATRARIRRLFVTEGALLGVAGATAGLILAQSLAWLVNHSGAMWTPPGQASPIPLAVRTTGVTPLLFSVWFVLVVLATIAAAVPAARAARLRVTDALRHV